MARGPIKHRGVSRKLGEWFANNKGIDLHLRDFRKDQALPADYDLSSSIWHIKKSWQMDIRTIVPGSVYRYVGTDDGHVELDPRGAGPAVIAEQTEAQQKIAAKEAVKIASTQLYEQLTRLESGECLLKREDDTFWLARQLR